MSAAAEHLASILDRGVVRVDYEADSFEEAVRGLLEPALQARGVDGDRVRCAIDAVLTRERSGSTCAGELALPHARVTGVPEIIASLGVNRKRIYPDGDVQFMIAFVTPQEAPAEHLRFLSEAARTFRDRALLGKVLAAPVAGEAIDAIRHA